jgi:peptidoglycan/xylan/chitin deacetylase (PgdA/CDA1 family)
MSSNSRLLIVNFHYIRENRPSSGIYPITPAEFSKQLDVLGKSFSFCSQADVIHWIDRGLPVGNFCLITFDDALAEQQLAIEILSAKGIPAIFYVPIEPYQTNTTLSVHKLHYLRSVMNDEEFLKRVAEYTGNGDVPLEIQKARIQYKYDNELAASIKYYLNFLLSREEAEMLIDTIFSSIVSDEPSFTKDLYLPKDRLIELAQQGMLGSHSTHHHPLSSLSSVEMRNDIEESLSFLQSLTGVPVQSFSYPYGSKVAVDENVVEVIKKTSLKFAVTMFRGVNTPLDLAERFLLKRVDTNDAPGGKNPLNDLIK